MFPARGLIGDELAIGRVRLHRDFGTLLRSFGP
jgi:hypothetical protein